MKIAVLENGPCVIETGGQFVVVRDGKEETVQQKAVALCRCGQSANKPFCDGSHKKAHFQAKAAEIRID
ncbi:MAG: CDGSH iron-sulfur domain-containing protein [Calditrichaeota bacterium]|nr:MAG: CDGSH iron-sulfur domain-containing protein [Calditrichota bacterium]